MLGSLCQYGKTTESLQLRGQDRQIVGKESVKFKKVLSIGYCKSFHM